MKKFLVISYDADQQQSFWDRLLAPSKELAEQAVSELRDYAVVVDVIEPAELLRIGTQFANASKNTVLAEWAETVNLLIA